MYYSSPLNHFKGDLVVIKKLKNYLLIILHPLRQIIYLLFSLILTRI
jgi:hypothetical protein